jgi:hypothetical protein
MQFLGLMVLVQYQLALDGWVGGVKSKGCVATESTAIGIQILVVVASAIMAVVFAQRSRGGHSGSVAVQVVFTAFRCIVFAPSGGSIAVVVARRLLWARASTIIILHIMKRSGLPCPSTATPTSSSIGVTTVGRTVEHTPYRRARELCIHSY